MEINFKSFLKDLLKILNFDLISKIIITRLFILKNKSYLKQVKELVSFKTQFTINPQINFQNIEFHRNQSIHNRCEFLYRTNNIHGITAKPLKFHI